jgi:hypothetical protein
LSSFQKRAWITIKKRAKNAHYAALNCLISKYKVLGISGKETKGILQWIEKECQISCHFKAEISLQKLTEDTEYRNLFEVGNSNGDTSLAFRIAFERQLFEDTFNGCPNKERVKYGTIEDGMGPMLVQRYGQDCFILKQDVKNRATFISGDSANWKQSIPPGTFKYCAHILLLFKKEELMGLYRASCGKKNSLRFHSYKEVQIHGKIRIGYDVELVRFSLKSSQKMFSLIDEFSKVHNCKVEKISHCQEDEDL